MWTQQEEIEILDYLKAYLDRGIYGKMESKDFFIQMKNDLFPKLTANKLRSKTGYLYNKYKEAKYKQNKSFKDLSLEEANGIFLHSQQY